MMKPIDIAGRRLAQQQIAAASFTKAKDLVAYMGAMQSQDYAMSKWAIGLRTQGVTQKDVEKALDKGSILRTHVLRPTWHIIPAIDIYWMLALSAGKIKSLMKNMDRQLEITEKIISKSNSIIEKCVADGQHTDRDAIGASLEKAKISLQKNRLSHLLAHAELDQIICSGKTIDSKRTYALLADRVPKKRLFSKEESLAMLAKKYLYSRGPATIADFSWWAGLTLTEARQGLESIQSTLHPETLQGNTYWQPIHAAATASKTPSVHLLPAYDEFIIGYKDRTAALAAGHQKRVLTVNGIFYPVIIVNNQVAGTWKRNFLRDNVEVETSFFQAPDKKTSKLVKDTIEKFKKFLALSPAIA